MIVVIVRARDEHDNIGKFCFSYRTADKILVADGGSVDDTKAIAKSFSNVEVRDYPGRVKLDYDYWRNNVSDHTNFLIAWAKEYNPDWIISDDCDIIPNYLLRRDFRALLSETNCNVAMAVRLYLYKNHQHFPNMAKPHGDHDQWQTSLWAWRGDLDLWTVNDNFPHFSFRIGYNSVKEFRTDTTAFEIWPPYCLLHYSWMNEKKLEKKIKAHRLSGSIPTMAHPLEFAGPLEDLPDFAHP